MGEHREERGVLNMKILLQETNWIERGPHQQHHLMDGMGH
jgi:hypothetical protein